MNNVSRTSSLDETAIERVERETQELTLGEYLSLLKKRWLLIAVNTLLFTIGGFFYTASQPKIYQATASIAVTPPQSKKIGDIQVESSFTFRESFIQTQQAILRSRTILKKVLSKIPDPVFEKCCGRKKDQSSESLLGTGMDVQAQKNTDILLVSYSGKSPEPCAFIANLFVDVFIEENEEKNNTQSMVLQWLKQEIPGIEGKMARTREAMLKFEEVNLEVLLVSKGQDRFSTDMMDQANQELQKINIQLLGMASRYRKCVEVRQKGAMEEALALNFFEESALFQKFRQQKTDMEALLGEYQLKYTPKHSKMVWLNQNLAKLEKKMWQEAEVFLSRQEENYKELVKKQETLEKLVQEQLARSVQLKQKYMEYDRLRYEYEGLQKAYNSLVDKMKELDLTASYRMGNIRKVDMAEAPLSPYKPKKAQNYLLSLMLGLIVGVGFVFLLEQFDERIKTLEEIQYIVRAPMLGTIPMIPANSLGNISMAVENPEASMISEAFQNVSTSLLFMGKEKEGNLLLFSSSMPEDGKTTVVCNLGLTISRLGYKVLIIDGDLRKPQIHKRFSLDLQDGLYEVLKGNKPLENCLCPISENLSCLTAGVCTINPYQFFISSKLEETLGQLLQKYQYILFDAPPVAVPETMLFAKMIKKLIFVVSDYHAYKKMLKDTVHRLEGLGLSVHGIVVNDIKGNYAPSHNRYYHYYSRYKRG